MSALAAARQTDRKEGDLLAIGLTAAGKVYQGGLVCRATDGYLAAAAATSGFRFTGVAYESKDNTSGADGDLVARVYRKGLFLFDIASATVTDIKKKVWVGDDQTVTLTPGKVFCGVIEAVESSTKVWVDIEPAVSPITYNRLCIPGDLIAVTTTAAGGILTLLNPFAARAIIMDLILDVTTKATGAATGDFGVASSVASADTLLDGVTLGSAGAAAILNVADDHGTNGVVGLAWPSGHYVTGTASATLAALVGTYFVDVLVPNAAIV